MSNLFKNEYKVYLYKYNYNKLQQVVQSQFSSQGNAYTYLFESFITDLYSIGVPSEVIKKEKEKYNKYIDDYYKINNPAKKSKKTKKGNNITATLTPDPTTLVDNSTNVFAYRSPKSSTENMIQEALAQNFALQRIQKDYEDEQMMGENSKIHWLNTKEKKAKYDAGIHSALDKSKKLLESLFNPIIEEISNIQKNGITKSDYVYCIDLTDLSKSSVINTPTTARTKDSCDNFLNPKIANRLISDDIETNALTNIGAIKTDLTQLTNATSFTLRQDILLKYGIYLEPNDIIEISATNYNKEIDRNNNEGNKDPLNRNTQFIGFITQLEVSSKYGQVTDIVVTCEGISKLLALNPVVSDNAVMPQFNNLLDFIANKSKGRSDMTEVNVYINFYSGKTVYDLFTDIMAKVLAAVPIKGDEKNYTVRYISDKDKLKNLQYQYCKSLIVLYHMAVSLSTVRQCGATDVIIAKVDCNLMQSKLEAYLEQLRANYSNFWATYSSPLQILNAIVENAFLEIYEDRCGVLIMRTPRYNTWFGNDIIPMNDIISWTQTINDSILKSRSDYQWVVGYLGTMSDFPGNSYENVPALLKYGFRADSPKISPNAKNERLCAVFGALDVTRENGKTRTLTVTVPMIKDYKLGKLYYIPIQDLYGDDGLKSSGCVGYLSSIISTVNPGNVDEHRLEFRYVRNAELLEEDSNFKGNLGRVLNFNHLPDLEILMNSFTSDDFEKPKDTSVKAPEMNSGIPAQYNYYWAAYDGAYKTKFDDFVSGRNVGLMSKDDKRYFDLSMAPTILKRSSFQSYKDNPYILLNSSYIPTQQLINDIWFIDMRLRYNEKISNAMVNSKSNIFYDSKILRSLTPNSEPPNSELLVYLNRDATFDGTKLLPGKISNDLNNYYANVGNFFVNESLLPSMVQSVNIFEDDDQSKRLDFFMTDFIDSYNYIINYNAQQKVDFMNAYKQSEKENNDKIIEFDSTCKILNTIIQAYYTYKENSYTFLNLYYLLFKNMSNGIMSNIDFIRGMFNNASTSINFKSFLHETKPMTSGYYSGNVTSTVELNNISFKTLIDYLNFEGSYSTKQSKNNPIKQLIPAVILNNNSFPPLRIFKNSQYGSYLTCVCPVDYKPFFKDEITPIIKTDVVSKKITLQDNSFRNARNEIIGTIEDLVFDPILTSELETDNDKGINLYFYPVIKFNKSAESMASEYMTSKSELQNFVNTGSSNKKLASVIVISPTQIPESKIPTIQQMAVQNGLYVGKVIKDGFFSTKPDEVNLKAAIFNPSVLYNWTRSELSNTYTATIYNLYSKHLTYKSRNNLKNWNGDTINLKNFIDVAQIEYAPCVFNTNLNFNKLSKSTYTHDSIKNNIENIFNSLIPKNKENSYFTIKKLDGTNYYQLEDRTESLQSGNDSNLENTSKSLRLKFYTDKTDTSLKDDDDKKSRYNEPSPDNVVNASVGDTNKTYSENFINYVKSREEVQVNLYTKNSQNSTIFYTDDEKYPTKVKRVYGTNEA